MSAGLKEALAVIEHALAVDPSAMEAGLPAYGAQNHFKWELTKLLTNAMLWPG